MTRLGAKLTTALAIAQLTGCSALSAQEDRTKYFVLTPLAVVEQRRDGFDRAVGVGPLTIPDHLERQLVTRLADEEIAISETDRWSEPLREALKGVLRQNLIALLGTERIVSYPWDPSAPPDLAVTLEVLQFERTAQRTAVVKARYCIERGADRAPLWTTATSVSKPIRGPDTRAAVAAMSAAVGDLSRQIAADVRRITSVSARAR
jgi:uncharacterized lipoprotein YmbA